MILGNILKNESYSKGIILSTLFNLFAKGLQFFSNVIIAYYFGTNTQTDIYFFISNTIVLSAAFINNLDSTIIIPESVRIREQHNEEESRMFINFFFFLYIGVIILSILLIFIFSSPILHNISHFKPTVVDHYKLMFILGLIQLAFVVLVNYLGNVIASYKYFTFPMIINFVNSVATIIFIITTHNFLGVNGIIIGSLTGYFFNIAFLIFFLHKNFNWKFNIKYIRFRNNLWSDLGYAQSGQIMSFISGFLPLYVLSSFGNGIISAFNYGKLIADIPISLISTQVTSVGALKFNELFSRQKIEELNGLFSKLDRLLTFLMIPISAFIFVYAFEITTVLFGNGIQAASLENISKFLRIFSVSIVFLSVNQVSSRLFMACQIVKYSFINQVVMNSLMILLTLTLSHIFNAFSYPISFTFINIVNFIGIFFWIRICLNPLVYFEVIKYLLYILVVNIVIILILFFLKAAINSVYINLILGGIIYLGLIFFINLKFKMNSDVYDYSIKFIKIISKYIPSLK